MLRDDIIVVNINTMYPCNADFVQKYAPDLDRYPWISIVDANGNLLRSTDTDALHDDPNGDL